MRIFQVAAKFFPRATKGPVESLKTPGRFLQDFFGGLPSSTGLRITERNSLTYSAVYAAVKILGEDVGSLPLITYKRVGRGKERAPDHPIFDLLHNRPNPEMSSLQWRETMQAHVLLWGNAFSEIEFDNGGRVKNIWPLPPWRVTRRRIDGELKYEILTTASNTDVAIRERPDMKILDSAQVLDLRGLSLNGIEGLSTIGEARESVGLGLGTEKFGATFFGHGAHLGGILEHPNALSDKAYERLKKSFNERNQGLTNAHRMDILEEGMKWIKIGIPPEDAQFLETRQFQINEIARWFRMPPHKLGQLDRATFSNVEQQAIDYVTGTLRPWLVRWEQEILFKLFAPGERSTFFSEFLIDGLLRGDFETRQKGYAVGRQWGYLSPNDVRERENDNPLPGPEGDVYLVPLNMVNAETLLLPPEPEVIAPPAPGEPELNSAHPTCPPGQKLVDGKCVRMTQEELIKAALSFFLPVLRATAARTYRRERADVIRSARKLMAQGKRAKFLGWLSEFYDKHLEFLRREFSPVFDGMAASLHPQAEEAVRKTFVQKFTEEFARRHADDSQMDLRNVVQRADMAGKEPITELAERFDGWDMGRPARTAKDAAKNLGERSLVAEE